MTVRSERAEIAQKIVIAARLPCCCRSLGCEVDAITALLGRTQSISGELPAHGPSDKELLNEIQRSQGDLHRLYEEVRRFAAPVVVEPMFRHVGNVVHEFWNDLAANRTGRDVQFSERATCDDLRCEIDSFAMGQVFRNIFDNALAASADHGFSDAELERD